MRRLHSVSPPEGLPKLWERFSPEVVLAEWNGALPSRMLERAAALAIQLRTHRADPAVLVHGDLVPSNVLIRPDGSVVIIDPIGFVGMRARDLAQMAVATAGRDRRLNLDDLLKGYGERPPFIDEVFAWLVFMFLEKNIELERAHPHTRATFVLELSSLAETFVANA